MLTGNAVCVQIKYNEVTYDTTFENYTMLTGNVVSLGMGGIICVVTSLTWPEDYDFVSMKQIRLLDDNVDSDMGFSKVGKSPLELVQVQCSMFCRVCTTLNRYSE